MLRRDFIKNTTAGIISLGVLSSIPFLSSKSKLSQNAKDFIPLLKGNAFFIYDKRFSESKTLKQAAQEANVEALSIKGDITQVWIKKLKPLWNSSSQPISGLSSPATLFLLSQVAKDQGKKVVKESSFNQHLVFWTIT